MTIYLYELKQVKVHTHTHTHAHTHTHTHTHTQMPVPQCQSLARTEKSHSTPLRHIPSTTAIINKTPCTHSQNLPC